MRHEDTKLILLHFWSVELDTPTHPMRMMLIIAFVYEIRWALEKACRPRLDICI